MIPHIRLAELGMPFLGSRYVGRNVRLELERLLREHEEVRLDFSKVEGTQSFVDELVGVLFAKIGPELTTRIVFSGCSPDVKAILQFVISSRLQDYRRLASAHPEFRRSENVEAAHCA